VNFQNARNLEEYTRILETGELQLWRALPLTPRQMLIREMILQLKTGALELDYFRRKFAVNIWNEFRPVYEGLEERGLLNRINERIELTRRGLLEVDHFLCEFFEPEPGFAQYV
jgi:oxygen-independent coproporphyrinogen-3 oxidase